MQQKSSALIVGLPHLVHFLVTVPKGCNCSILAVGRSAHDAELMDLDHLLDDRCRATGIAQPPAGHSISFRKSIDEDRPLFHSRNGCDTHMPFPGESKLRVDFITQYVQIVLNDDFGYCLKVFLLHDGAGRIIREGKNQNLGLFRDRILQLLCRQAELVLRLKRNRNRYAIRQCNAGRIRNIARLRNKHFISRIKHGAHAKIDSFAAAYRDQGLRARIVLQAKSPAQISAAFLAQLQQTGIGRIEGLAPFQGINTLIADDPGRIEIRFPNAQGHHIVHLAHYIKKLANAGGL